MFLQKILTFQRWELYSTKIICLIEIRLYDPKKGISRT
jgi:hypothetical protein